MSGKKRIGILFGGQSAEHEVSLQSAINVFKSLDRDKFEPVLIAIDRQGKWQLILDHGVLTEASQPRELSLNNDASSVTLVPGNHTGELVDTSNGTIVSADIAVIFPVLHGPKGEDGSVQGLLELVNMPYVGAGVLGSAIGMDKDVMKRLLRDAGISVADYVVVTVETKSAIDPAQLVKVLGLPLFVKPSNMGSSVGVSMVSKADDLPAAINLALQFDRKVLIERAVTGDEVECAIIGNETPRASLPGRIVMDRDFYSYADKYINADDVQLEIPAQLSPELTKRVQDIAVRAFEVLQCEGMARVDMFVDSKTGDILVNEINTIPGFTDSSMYPKLWQASGLDHQELVTELIELATERHDKRKALSTSYLD